MANIDRTKLKAGDVLLYHGSGIVSDLIRLFDGSTYSHASIYDGSEFVEALGQGVVSNTLNDSIADADFVDVFRFRSTSSQGLDGPDYGAQPVIDRAKFYLEQGDRYGYEQIILLAFLAATRQLPVGAWVPGGDKILRTFLDNGAMLVNDLIAGGRQPMICSELVYRCYGEAGDKYKLKIVGADLLRKSSIHDNLLAGLKVAVPASDGDRDAQELAAAAQEFMQLFSAGRNTEIQSLAVADFVTPRDLYTSPNLILVGRLNG